MARKTSRAARRGSGSAGAGRRRRANHLFETALDAHRQGRIGDAERLYQDVLGAEPDHTGALQHLGILAQQRGDLDESVRLLSRAAAITPSDPLLQNNLGNALRSRGDHAQAISAYRAAVASAPPPVVHASQADSNAERPYSETSATPSAHLSTLPASPRSLS